MFLSGVMMTIGPKKTTKFFLKPTNQKVGGNGDGGGGGGGVTRVYRHVSDLNPLYFSSRVV